MESVYNIMSKVKESILDKNKSREVDESKDESKDEPKDDLESICLLFPTYATKHLEGKITEEWHVRIRGWAFSAPKKSRTRSLFLGLTSLAIQKDDERFQFLESRTSYFWASNLSQGTFSVQVDGLTDPNKMSIEGDPNDEGAINTTVEPHGEGVTLTTANIAVPDVKKVLSKAEKVITAPFHPESEASRISITPKSGHFTGKISIQKDIVGKWAGKENEGVVSGFISNIVGKDKDRARLLKLKVFRDHADSHYGVVNLVEPDGVSLISDIDDTIKDTNILRGAKNVLTTTFLQPFRDVPGMAEVYRNFYDKGVAIHYVSNSPWQLFPSLRIFFQTYHFPPGSAHFKFYDGLIKSAYEQKENPMASKFMYIRELLKDFPNRQFILVGDTGELDPEIYTTIARENPGRILRIYVRDVTTDHVKDLPPQKPKHSYTRTFPTIYNYLRNYYSDDSEEKDEGADKEAEDAAAQVITKQAVEATSGEETSETSKPERKSSYTNRLLDKFHVDISYLYGTTLTDSPDSTSIDSSSSKPKTPLSARIISPERAASISAKFSKLRSASTSSKSDKSDKSDSVPKEAKDDDLSDENEGDKDKTEELKTPLEMFHERLKLLGEGLPEGLFHTFTDAKELENDTAIRAALKY